MDNLYANVPRDLTRVKSKLFLNLTRRQILCFGAAIGVGLPLYFLLRKTGNSTMAAMVMILVMLPFFFFAMYERNGQPLEVVLRHFIAARFKRPQIRRYRTKNRYHRRIGYRRDRRREEEVLRQKERKEKTEKKKAGSRTADSGREDAVKTKKKIKKTAKMSRAKRKALKGRKEAGHVRKA
ncbi:MAG: PrgI family protein [Eubacterium sp.]|nr:PrgI family protein [Eubacterium sp.]